MPEKSLLDELTRKLGEMAQRQQQFQQEITELQRAIYELKRKELADTKTVVENQTTKPPEVVTIPITEPVKAVVPKTETQTQVPPKKKTKTPIEEFIGTNLLNKVGIAVLVIGVGIGAQYSIDHNLIDPLTRIVLGYFCGVILIGLAIRLKPKYQNFSAVLLSGGLAVFYFITFAAYDLYSLMPQAVAFALMVLFTAFTVFAALKYDLVVVAIIGLVGAYAVPFLLSDGSGQVIILLSYVAIINTGILVLAFKKHWKSLYYLAFSLTWIIYAAWYSDRYNANDHLWTSLSYSTVFFATFYVTLLSYKLIRGESLGRWDILLLLLNSFIYFGFGYDAIASHSQGEVFLGIFTLFNAILHFTACLVIFKTHGQSRDIFFFAAGLVLVFITLAVPVQLEGNWVTMIWAAEGVLLFWLGRTKKFRVYEFLSYPLILLAFISLAQDWDNFYSQYSKDIAETYVTPILNIQFLTSLLVCGSFAMVYKINKNEKFESPLKQGSMPATLFDGGIPALLLITLYLAFFLEISNYWSQRYVDSEIIIQEGEDSSYHNDYDLTYFKNIWLLNYSALFILALAIAQIRWIKNKIFGYILVAASGIVTFSFITSGLTDLRALLVSYINQEDAEFYFRNIGYVLIRYISIAFLIPLLWVNYRLSRGEEFTDVFRKAERIFFHIVVLAVLSSELVNGLALARIEGSDKLVLTILWGIYALSLIVYGLIKELKYIRITAITLFGITLLKLVFYDMADMSTISKIIVMIVLGALMLVASFLYNKFKKPTNVPTP